MVTTNQGRGSGPGGASASSNQPPTTLETTDSIGLGAVHGPEQKIEAKQVLDFLEEAFTQGYENLTPAERTVATLLGNNATLGYLMGMAINSVENAEARGHLVGELAKEAPTLAQIREEMGTVAALMCAVALQVSSRDMPRGAIKELFAQIPSGRER